MVEIISALIALGTTITVINFYLKRLRSSKESTGPMRSFRFPNRRFRIQKAGVDSKGQTRYTGANERRYWATWHNEDGNHVSVWWQPDGSLKIVHWNNVTGVTNVVAAQRRIRTKKG